MASLKELLTDSERVLAEVAKVVVGKREAPELVRLATPADGHALIEAFPGLAMPPHAAPFAPLPNPHFHRAHSPPRALAAGHTSFCFDSGTTSFRLSPATPPHPLHSCLFPTHPNMPNILSRPMRFR